MNYKSMFFVMMFVIGVAGCSDQSNTEGESGIAGTEPATEPAGTGVVEKVEETATDSAKVIEGNVESIEADIEKSQEESAVNLEDFKRLEKFPKESAMEPVSPPVEVIEEQVEVVEDEPAKK